MSRKKSGNTEASRVDPNVKKTNAELEGPTLDKPEKEDPMENKIVQQFLKAFPCTQKK